MEKKRCYGCMKLKASSPVCEHCGYDENTRNAPHQLPAGTVLKEQYLVGRVLGQGGFGITYLGWDLYLDIPVAVKEYYPNGAVMRETSVTMDVVSCDGETGSRFRNNKERFLREAKMLARFSQVPQIVQVKNFFLANNTAYIVMEYVEGITLKQYVKEHGGKLSVEETFTILGPVVEALCKVHKAGLVHRDISPDNIMMLPQGGAKLLDFGAVRDVGAASVDKGLTKSTEAILKQGYAPIEQYQKRGSLGPWTDVYALCATMYYCMTGQVPPDAPERLLGDEDLNWRGLIPELTPVQKAALEHGMELRAEKRTSSMEVLHEELFRKEDAPPITEHMEVEPPLHEPHIKTSHVSKKHQEKGKKTAEQKQKTSHTDEKSSEPGEKTTQASGEGSEQETGKTLAGKGRMILIGVLGAAAVLLVCLILVLGGRGKEDAALPTEGDGNTISGHCGLDLTWVLDRDTGELTISGSGKMYDYRWDGYYELTGLIAPWNSYRDQITSVIMEDGVTVVGACAFAGCENLKTVQLPGTLVEIRHNAFDQCALTELTLPDGLQTIGEGAFSWNPLKTVTIPDSVRYVGSDSFDCNPQLESVTIGPDTRLNYDTWYPIFSGNGFTIHGYTNSMAEDYAQILGCNFVSTGENQWDAEGQCGDNLYWHLDLGTGFLKIDGEGQMWDFNGTWQLEEENKDQWNDNRELPPWSRYRGKIYVVSISDGVTSIGESAFESCDNLVDVSFGNTLETIGYQSFLCTAVDEIALPNSVTDIDSFAFNWCGDLYQIRLPKNLKRLKENAIAECENLRELYVGWNTIIDESHGLPFTLELEGNGLHTVTYPNLTIYGLQNSDAERFAAEYGFSFKIGAWPEAWGWARLIAEAQGQCGDDIWWFLGNDTDTLVVYGTGKMWDFNGTWQLREEHKDSWIDNRELPPWSDYQDQITNLFFLGDVTYIGENAFSGCNLSGTVDLGSSVRTIGANAFLESGIQHIVIPEQVTSIGHNAFNWCESLTSVWLPDNLDRLQATVFNQCRNLQKLYVGGKTILERDGKLTPFTQLGATLDDETVMPYNLTIYGYENSDAERFAKEYDIPFVLAPAE